MLREEIERPRVGPMRDIVATIQPDQDRLVRADLDHSVCVQGAPGTGKTAVGLHRAAYLLYAHRQRLRRNGVLVLGPNTAFLRYIAAVLPALGGSIGVIASPGAVSDLTKALRDKGIPVARVGEFDKDARVTVLSVEVAKGLEYDHVVVAEPADLVHARELPPRIS